MVHKPQDRRRICWPNPDVVCMQGGCTYCEDSSKRIGLGQQFTLGNSLGMVHQDILEGWDRARYRQGWYRQRSEGV